ncbi:transcription elongation factor SPT6-like isoform X1 [Styela clava]|uniref:transcription elongation factor SPT6-like isoform X1 n=1 Tax=Styela clava TaxID=7725 RepID=UPI00193A48E4|nr:transcription elongation factor SPT6-like isoform X1 [Styela clava]
MSDFFDDEAEESSDEEFVVTKKKKPVLSDDDAPSEDDAEDEEEVDKKLAAEADDQGNIRDLIDDDIDDDEDESDASDSDVSSEDEEPGGKHRDVTDEEEKEEEIRTKRSKRKHDHRLEDDDLDLIEENLGVKIKRKKFSRLKTVSSDEDDSDKEEDTGAGGHRQNVANEIFQGEEYDYEPGQDHRQEPVIAPVDEEGEESDESDVDDFIVDDNGEPISKPHQPGQKRKKKGDAALQNLHDIFGVDFDFSEFEKYGDEYEDEEMEMEEDYIDEMDEEGVIVDSEMRPKKKSRKAKKKKSIFDVYEPDTLERGYFTDFDAEIRNADVPERFQLRTIPVRPADNAELELEADWIYKHCFVETTISKQENYDDIGASSSLNRKPQSSVAKIQDSLNFMRNQQFEMPFIAFYRKEYVEPELNIYDLNKIYHWDEKWTQLLNRKANLTRLLQKMQTYQYEQISRDPDKPLGDNIRALTDADIERIQNVQTMDELKDVYAHFLLHYGRDIPKMQNALRTQRQRERNEDGTSAETDEAQASDLKQASRRDMYTVCLNAGLGGVANKFGLTPEQFGENLRDNYQRHETEQYPAEPKDLAQDFITPQFDSIEKVLEGARYMMAMQLAREPLVRQCVRQTFQERAKINVNPTKKGKKEIDEAHPLFGVRWLRNKPVRDLNGPCFLHLANGELERLVEIDIRIDMKDSDISGTHTYFEEIKQLYYRDEFSHLVQEWNSQRSQVIDSMLNKILYPELVKETRATLLREAREGIINHCALALRKWLSVAPYQPEEREDEEEDEGRQGCVVMAVSYSDNRDSATFATVISGDGEVTDFLRLPFMRMRRNAPIEDDRKRKEKDLDNIKNFITKRKPHVIVIGAEDRYALMLQEDIKECVTELEQEGSIPAISVELMDNELAAVYAATKRSETDFRDYPVELRQAVSLARRMQDPMLEFSQLCSQDDDLMCLKFHPLQDQVEKDQLLTSLVEEFVFRACEVGVDVNRAISHPHTANIVQFVCGLGPRKAAHLVKVLKQKNGRLENRSNLVTVCRMGPKIFINCAGFIKIDTSSLGDSTDVYIEVLDGLRVHPETYEWARKMAVDALEYDESAEDANPSSALEEILESPERLKDLDLDAFADELERQGYGNKGITLYDIRNELDCRYKDLRTSYRAPTAEERFSLITKETLSSFQEGKLVTCRVVGIAYRRPKAEQLDQAEPHKDENTGTWSCSFCGTGGFGELSEVWSHLDSGDCLGKAVGVRTRLDNGLSGFISTDRLSDSKVTNPEERVKVGMTVHCRITKIDIDKFQVDLSSKSSDLRNESEQWGSVFDTYYDHEAEEKDKQSSQNNDKNKNRTTYIKRVIAHPSFQNIGFKEAEKVLESMDQGDVIIRPSSKGADHLTATWKVGDHVCAHIDIREEGKENSFSLGKTLLIGNDEFEDLDEIIARFIQPMAANARDILNHKYYRESNGGKKDVLEELLKQAKKNAPSRIPYFMSECKELPGKFLLSYMPRTKPKHEYVTVLSDGFRYRGQVFTTINQLFKWFKEHFRDPIPHHLMPSRTPAGASSNSDSFNVAAIQNALQKMQTPRGQSGPFATPLPRGFGVTPNAAVIPHTPNYPPQQTPNYGQQRTPSSFTPRNRTPVTWGHPPAAVPNRTPSGGGNIAATDWGKAAEEWARKKVSKSTPRMTPSGTPRGPRTPAGSYKGTPRTPTHHTPRGGGTPV